MVETCPPKRGWGGSEIDDSALGIVFDDGFSNMFIIDEVMVRNERKIF